MVEDCGDIGHVKSMFMMKKSTFTQLINMETRFGVISNESGFGGNEGMISFELQKEKPCATCPIDMRDRCWKGRAFACEAWYAWIRKCIEGN